MLEPLQTLGTRVRHLPRVHPHVAGKLLPLAEMGATLLTLKIEKGFLIYHLYIDYTPWKYDFLNMHIIYFFTGRVFIFGHMYHKSCL